MQAACRTLRLTGLVQGVGFRPTLWRVAVDLGLNGSVYNDASGVIAVIEGTLEALDAFEGRLRQALGQDAPLARLDGIELLEESSPKGHKGFLIETSRKGLAKTMMPPDAATCDACALDMFTAGNRRWRYAFTNCTHCGPRFTITRRIPYDRKETSMASFAMCPKCQHEYDNPADRRFHAQPNACPVCGPQLKLTDAKGVPIQCDDVIAAVLNAIRQGKIVAIKGLGGFHLACDAANVHAVKRLRQRKHRDEKAFAVMFANTASARKYAFINETEKELLESVGRPIVLCPKKSIVDAVMPGVAPGLVEIGVMLAYTPVHLLLFHEAADRPAGINWLKKSAVDLALVMTSANPSDQPLVIGNDEAVERLGDIADLILMNNREIVTRCDDSVVRVVDDKVRPIRRSRGFTPLAVKVKRNLTGVVATGPALKTTAAVGRSDEVFLTEHVGDTQSVETCVHLKTSLEHLLDILEVKPRVVACDMHPDFYSTRLAYEIAQKFSCPVVSVQHHHAHVAAVAAEHGIDDREYFGLALDGVGLGLNHEIWGAELLHCKAGDFTRIGHLAPMALPGGDKAAREPWRMGAVLLDCVGKGDLIQEFWPQHADLPIRALIANKHLTRPCTSMGRLFDGVASLTGLIDVQHDEARAAMLLEAAAFKNDAGDGLSDTLHWPLLNGAWVIKNGVLSVKPLLEKLIDMRLQHAEISEMSRVFHATLSAALSDWIAKTVPKGANVCLSGGTFLNRYLSSNLSNRLTELGFQTYLPERLPCNDGGVSFGQAVVAAQKLLND